MGIKQGKMPAQPGIPKQSWQPGVTHPAPFCNTQLTSVLTYSLQLQNNPTILAEDAAAYKDQKYVRIVADMFWAITKATEIPVTQIKKFRISDMEKAFAKLAKEQREEYKEMCKFWGIVPEKHCTKTPTRGVSPHSHLSRLNRWGYFEIYFPNIEYFVDLIVKKTSTSSKTMTKIEIAKYAQIFMLFILGQSFMPYDFVMFYETKKQLEEKGIKIHSIELQQDIINEIISKEKKSCWSASTLYTLYSNPMRDFPDGAIDIDAVMYFMDLIDYKHKLVIKEFMDMISTEVTNGASEKSDFKAMHLSPIMSNVDIRDLKEQIFPMGIWDSDVALFMTNIPDKTRRSYRYAYNRFAKNGFRFGEGVESVEVPQVCKHLHSEEQYMMYRYKYAGSPLAVRISDPNELWMMRRM